MGKRKLVAIRSALNYLPSTSPEMGTNEGQGAERGRGLGHVDPVSQCLDDQWLVSESGGLSGFRL